MAELSDFLSPEMHKALAEVHEAAEKEPSWFTDKWFELRNSGMSEQETLREVVLAWERKKSRQRVDEARSKQNQKQHDRLLDKHKKWSHLIDPERED